MKLADAIKKVREAGVQQIIINYSGGGDSGAIDNVEFMPEQKYDFKDDINGCFEALGYELLQDSVDQQYDWINNDGGSGSIEIDIKDGELSYNIAHSQNTSVSTTKNAEGMLTAQDGDLYEQIDKFLSRHADTTSLVYELDSEENGYLHGDAIGSYDSMLIPEKIKDKMLERVTEIVDCLIPDNLGDKYTQGTITFKRVGSEIKFFIENHRYDESTEDAAYDGTVDKGDMVDE